jgi:lysophospholipase L1-like esterase
MDAIPPDPAAAEMRPQQASETAASNRTVDYCAAAILAVLAFAISPVAIRLLTGRTELGFRPFLLSVTFDLFLLLVGGAMLAHGRWRRLFFHLIAYTLPFVLLAGIETLAGTVHLSDHVAMFQDLSTIKRGNNWGPGAVHLAPEKDGFAVYRPWSGNGVTINELGLRTALPTPKSKGEHRIAVVGSSETWGTRLAEADTISALLQSALRRNGRENIFVYNFGIEDATLARELALLQHFKTVYDIDQAIFIVGGGDVYKAYFEMAGQFPDGAQAGRRIASFELYKTVQRIRASWFEPSQEQLAWFADRYPARSGKNDRLVEGILGANDYCRKTGLRCDFILQPLIEFRRPLIGSETKIAQTYSRLYPGLNMLAGQMYRQALSLGLTGQIHDLTTVFNGRSEQFFFDGGHVNEAGNVAIVDALLPIALLNGPSN